MGQFVDGAAAMGQFDEADLIDGLNRPRKCSIWHAFTAENALMLYNVNESVCCNQINQSEYLATTCAYTGMLHFQNFENCEIKSWTLVTLCGYAKFLSKIEQNVTLGKNKRPK